MKGFVYVAGTYASSAILLKVCGFLLSIWMARSLEVAEYGQWGLLFAIQTGLATFGVVGILESVVGLLRRCHGSNSRASLFAAANGVFFVTIGVSLLMAFVVSVFVFEVDVDTISLIPVFVSGGLLAFAVLQAQLIRLEERHIRSIAYSFFVPAVALFASAVSFSILRTAESFFLGSMIGLLFSITSLGGAGLSAFGGQQDRSIHRRQIFARLGPYAIVAFFGWISGYGNNFIISRFFETTEVARFTFAMSIGAIMPLVASALNQVWSPRFFRITQAESIKFVEDENWKFYFLLSMVLGLVAMFSIVVVPRLLTGLGGRLSFYSSMRLEYFFLFSGYIILTPWWHCSNYLMAYDRGRGIMNVVIWSSAVGVPLWLLFMWLFGPLGIYIGFFAQMLLRSVAIVLIARDIWALRINWLGPLLGISIAAVGLLKTI